MSLLWLIPAIPFASAAVLALFGPKLPRRVTALLGAGSVGISALIAIFASIQYFRS
ncbi:MAG: hypothetical protein JOZ62_12200, partial [Acidobacteriaceae bacterium]|nr:hypothetical protein [Acidobacteriaceae bacterium]